MRSYGNCQQFKGRGSSVVERIIGNDEAESSILSRGTILISFISIYHAIILSPKYFYADSKSVLPKKQIVLSKATNICYYCIFLIFFKE